MASAFIDRQLTDTEAARYLTHIAMCPECHEHMEQSERVSLMLKNAERPDFPRELHSYVMAAVKQRSERAIRVGQLFFEWLLKLNPRLVSYATGLLVSTALFAGTMSGFRPIPVMEPIAQSLPSSSIPVITGSDFEYHTYNGLPRDPGSAETDHFYELPRVITNSSLVSFSHIAYRRRGNEGAAALVEVSQDGHARILEVLGRPTDPYLIELLQWSLSKGPFQPAKQIGSGQAVPTRIVLVVQKMDVSG